MPIDQQLIDQAIAVGIITKDQYNQIPLHEQDSMEYIFSRDGHQAVADGIITLDQYLQIPSPERYTMIYLFSFGGRQAVADGIITLDRYLGIPVHERDSMTCLFSTDGRQAVADGIITLDRYLWIPLHERDSMIHLFSTDGRRAVADGIITLDQYLRIQKFHRDSMAQLFSREGRRAVASGTITLNEYLLIPPGNRRNIMTALQDPETRQRIKDGELTIRNLIGDNGGNAVAANVNGGQSTHNASVHKTVSESATRLATRYQAMIDGAGLESNIEMVQAHVISLSDDSEKNKAAKRCVIRITAPGYTFTDPSSHVTTRQLLALTFLAVHDAGNREGSLEDARVRFVEGLYEIQRGYNLSDTGVDQGGSDRVICAAGTFNKLIEKLQAIHPDCQIIFITKATASAKLPIVVREEAMRYLEALAAPNTAEALLTFTELMSQVKKDGIEVIWNNIKDTISERMFDEFGCLYQSRTDHSYIDLMKAGLYTELGGLSAFEEQVQNPKGKQKSPQSDLFPPDRESTGELGETSQRRYRSNG